MKKQTTRLVLTHRLQTGSDVLTWITHVTEDRGAFTSSQMYLY